MVKNPVLHENVFDTDTDNMLSNLRRRKKNSAMFTNNVMETQEMSSAKNRWRKAGKQLSLEKSKQDFFSYTSFIFW